MTRAKASLITKSKHKKILKLAKGYRGRSNNCYRIALERVEKALQYSYRDRRNRKRTFRSLWIQRINAAVRLYGLNYSTFMNLMQKNNVIMDRKVLSDIAVKNPEDFEAFVKSVLDNKI